MDIHSEKMKEWETELRCKIQTVERSKQKVDDFLHSVSDMLEREQREFNNSIQSIIEYIQNQMLLEIVTCKSEKDRFKEAIFDKGVPK